jgi:AhpD family alkylhydroperoxidase
MGYLSTQFDAFTGSLAQVDAVLDESCPLEKKIDELMRFALSIKARSQPCVRKHFKGAREAGASDKEISYVFALTMREAAGADDCWTHGVISDLVGGEPGKSCDCD